MVVSQRRGDVTLIPDDPDVFSGVVEPVLMGIGATSPPREITTLDSRALA
jgi:hypothetical protein